MRGWLIDWLIARLVDGSFSVFSSCFQIRASVRVSVQSVALSCLTDLINLEPSLLFQTRFTINNENTDQESPENETQLHSLCSIFLNHTDPLLQAHGAMLSCLLSVTTVNPLLTLPADLTVDVEGNLRKTAAILRQESPAAARLAVEALERCLEAFLFTEEWAGLALDIVWEALALLTDTTVTYWLLKVELLRFLRAVPFTHLLYLESVCRDVSSFFSCNFLCRFF